MTVTQILSLLFGSLEPLVAQAVQAADTSTINPAIDKLVAGITSPPEAVAAAKDFAPGLKQFAADLVTIELGRLAALAPKA